MLIAGNWKMNTDLDAARALAEGVAAALTERGDALDGVEVAVCPPFVSLTTVRNALGESGVRLGAQTVHPEDAGAYTGAISAPMLRSACCTYVIVGHSERRQHLGETDADVNARVRQALHHDLVPIVCVGETKAERDDGQAQAVVQRQLDGALERVMLDDPSRVVVAYEPVWAIGAGASATPLVAQGMHTFIRGALEAAYGSTTGRAIRLLYGGSMKPANALALLEQPDIDGGLVGGASLDAEHFAALADAAAEALAMKA